MFISSAHEMLRILPNVKCLEAISVLEMILRMIQILEFQIHKVAFQLHLSL